MSISESSTAALKASSEVLRDTAALLAAVERIAPKVLSVAGPDSYSILVRVHAEQLAAIADNIARTGEFRTARRQAAEAQDRVAESPASVLGSIQDEVARLLERAAAVRNAPAGDDRALKALEQELKRDSQSLLLRDSKGKQ